MSADPRKAPGRPGSATQILYQAAWWVELGDQCVAALAKLNDRPTPTMGTQVQDDLRILARYLDEHPDIDTAMMRAIHGETTL